MRFVERVREWYDGKLVIPDDDPDSGVVFLGFHHERHWTAEVARVLAGFYLRNWQWLIGTIIAVLSLWVAILALK